MSSQWMNELFEGYARVSIEQQDVTAQRNGLHADDVAALIAAVAVEPEAPELIEFGGPEPLSRNEAITIAVGLTGRPIKRQRVARPILRLGMHLLGRPNDALASFFGPGPVPDLADSSWDENSATGVGHCAKIG
jgi:nucleoside-diphosphate-sugar epimerase